MRTSSICAGRGTSSSTARREASAASPSAGRTRSNENFAGRDWTRGAVKCGTAGALLDLQNRMGKLLVISVIFAIVATPAISIASSGSLLDGVIQGANPAGRAARVHIGEEFAPL